MKINKLKPGMTVYSVGRHKMGNTTLSTVAIWPVHIQEVDVENGRVRASWNGNRSDTFYEGSYSKWRATEPMTIKGVFGSRRLATRAEIEAAKTKSC